MNGPSGNLMRRLEYGISFPRFHLIQELTGPPAYIDEYCDGNQGQDTEIHDVIPPITNDDQRSQQWPYCATKIPTDLEDRLSHAPLTTRSEPGHFGSLRMKHR